MAKFRIYNDTLCPDLWDQSQHLDPEVRIALLKIAEDFYNKTKFVSPIVDVWLMGSIANFNWTPDSDADVHVIIDFSQMKMPPETASKVAKNAGAQWNKEHNITVKGHKVEVNIQSVKAEKPYVQGIYSLITDKWLRHPSKLNVNLDKLAIQTKFSGMKKYVEDAIKTKNQEQMKKAKDYLDAFRQYGLDNGGELSVENIVYKILRAKGLVKALKDAIIATYDKEMTVTEFDEKEYLNKAHLVKENDNNHEFQKFVIFDCYVEGQPGEGSFTIYSFTSRNSKKGNAKQALLYLKRQYGYIAVTDIGYPGDSSYNFWKHSLANKWVDEVHDDQGIKHTNSSTMNEGVYPIGARFGLGAIGANDDVQFKEFPRDIFSNQSHGMNGNPFGRRRFRYLNGTIEWSDCARPDKEQIDLVNSYLERRGYPVKNHTSIYDQHDVDEVTQKDLRARHPQSRNQWNDDWTPKLSKMTLDNLKAMRDKINRAYQYAQKYKKEQDISQLLAQYTVIDNEIKRRLAYINAPITETFVHSFETTVGGKTNYVEVFKNPSTKEFKESKPNYEVGAILDGRDIYVWNREKALHKTVMTQMKLSNSLPLLLIPDNTNPNRFDILVTDATKGTHWNHNPKVARYIKSHPFFRGKQIDHIMYWDEDIVGDWAKLKTDTLTEEGASNDHFNVGPVFHNTLSKEKFSKFIPKAKKRFDGTPASKNGLIYFSIDRPYVHQKFNPRTITAFLSIKNPWDFRNHKHVDDLVEYLKTLNITGHNESTLRKSVAEGQWGIIENYAIDWIKDQGYDAIIMQESPTTPLTYAVFSSDQVKIVDQNDVSEIQKFPFNYVGDCRDEELVISIFGSVSEFARQVELHGDEFEYKNFIIKYDPENDIHSFFAKLNEGYGYGHNPEKDPLHNTGERWRIKWGTRKTPLMKEDEEFIDNLLEQLLMEAPELKTLKKNRHQLTDDERKMVMDADATWHHGPNGEPSPAVWKSIIKGKTWYVTNTHRCYQVKPTLKGAINAYHKVVKQTA